MLNVQKSSVFWEVTNVSFMRKPVLILCGGLLIVIVSAVLVFLETRSYGEVIDVLSLSKIRRVGISIPFGYFFMVVGVLGILRKFITYKVSRDQDIR